MNKINNWKTGWLIAGLLFLSGCASVQIVGSPSSFKSLPPVIVIGDITPKDENVGIPPEKIMEGQEIMFETFKDELPEFTVFKNVQDLPSGVENYLLVETKISVYRELRPQLVATLVFAGAGLSEMAGEMTVTKYKERETILRFPGSTQGGLVYGKSGAYTQGLKLMAKGLAKTIRKYAKE